LVSDALEQIAGSLVPKEDASAVREIHVGRGRLQIDPGHDSRPELSATITLLGGEGKNQPIETSQLERRDRILERLRSLGAQERQWRDEKAGPRPSGTQPAARG
jgi:hypothetical protein